jgi:hypothetical protein
MGNVWPSQGGGQDWDWGRNAGLTGAPFNLHSVIVGSLFVLVMTQYRSKLFAPVLTSFLLLVGTNNLIVPGQVNW